MKALQPLIWGLALALMLALASSFALSLAIGTAWAGESHRHHDHAPATVGAPAPAEKWATDQPLRSGMARIRQAALQALPAGRPQPISDDQASVLSRDIQAATAYMIDNCTLAPQADAALHGVLAELLQGAEALPRAAEREQAGARILAALARYPELFDDPHWNAPEGSARH